MKKKVEYNDFSITLRRWRKRWFDSLPIIGKRRIEQASNKLAKEIGSSITLEPYPFIKGQPD